MFSDFTTRIMNHTCVQNPLIQSDFIFSFILSCPQRSEVSLQVSTWLSSCLLMCFCRNDLCRTELTEGRSRGFTWKTWTLHSNGCSVKGPKTPQFKQPEEFSLGSSKNSLLNMFKTLNGWYSSKQKHKRLHFIFFRNGCNIFSCGKTRMSLFVIILDSQTKEETLVW